MNTQRKPQDPAESPGAESTRPLMRIAPRQLPKKLTELGRIRIGDREPNANKRGTHPHKLNEFRLTSPNSPLLHFAANLYGGEVRPWVSEGAPTDEGGRPTQWELYTQANAIDVLIPTMSALSLQYELWSAGGCQRRCTGEVITHCADESQVGAACVCSLDDQERGALAKTGKACARILRLNVLLPDLPGMGSWRLETKGFYATAELLGTLEMLQMAGAEHQIIEGVLRLEQRTIKRPGTGEGKGTLKFVVPILWPKYTPRQILASATQRGMLLMAPAVETPPARLAERAAQVADELYGDGGGESLLGLAQARQHAPVQALSGEAVPTQKTVGDIHALHSAHGRDETWIARYWDKMLKRLRVSLATDLSPNQLEGLYGEAVQVYAKQAPGVAQVETSPPPQATDTQESTTGHPGAHNGQDAPYGAGAWRAMLDGLLAGLLDVTLAREVQSLLEDADASEEAGHHMIFRVVSALDTQAEDVPL